MKELLKIFGSKMKALEILALLNDKKPVVRQGFYEHELPKVLEFCDKNKIFYETSKFKVKITDEHKDFSDKGERIDIKDPEGGMLFVYMSKDQLKANLANYFELIGESEKLGLTLGYPPCCAHFFAENEERRSNLDNSYIEPALERSSGEKFPFYNNPLLRHKDFALVSHFPCSFNCEDSARIGGQNLELLREKDRKIAEEFEKNLCSAVSFKNKKISFA